MLLLVFPDRHMSRAVDQDIGRHQVWISIKPDRGVLAVLSGLLLELGHAIEPAEPRDAVEYPGELGVLGDLALVEHDVAPGIDAARNEGGRDLAGCARQLDRVLPDRDRMQIDDAVDAIVAILQLNEFDNGAEIIAEMQITGRLYPGKYAFLESHKLSSCSPCCMPRRPIGAQGRDD